MDSIKTLKSVNGTMLLKMVITSELMILLTGPPIYTRNPYSEPKIKYEILN
jgi:hypothetical protein